jgi:RimJ/RimL family protein N-acetyltransferase
MTMMETERLIIRDFKADDWADLYEYLSKEIVVRYEPYGVFSIDDAIKEAEKRSKNECYLAVCLKGNNKLIGNVYFGRQEPEDILTWEIGYVFNSEYWGRGYAAEACRKVLEYGFMRLGAHRIAAMCNPRNKASWRLMERLNMRREGHLLKNIFFKRDKAGNPLWIDTYEYAILSEEWLGLNI